jgi:hypothetical protein
MGSDPDGETVGYAGAEGHDWKELDKEPVERAEEDAERKMDDE